MAALGVLIYGAGLMGVIIFTHFVISPDGVVLVAITYSGTYIVYQLERIREGQ